MATIENSGDLVRVSVGDEGVAELLICRPKALNALNAQVLGELAKALEDLASLEALRCLIITGEGDRAFVAGADIAAMAELNADEAEAFARRGHDIFEKIESFPTPVLAAVNGFALGGGCELALACDVIYASDKAKFGQPEVKLGLIPGFGGTIRLVKKVGFGTAADWIFTGDVVTAERARECGLVAEVVAADELVDYVRKKASLIAKQGPVAVRAAKRSMRVAMGSDATQAASVEQREFGQLFTSEDMREGTQAFIEKRKPNFQGK